MITRLAVVVVLLLGAAVGAAAQSKPVRPFTFILDFLPYGEYTPYFTALDKGWYREEGLDVKISTWARNAPNTTPAMAKSVANYANAQLIKMEAIADGYAEGIALDTQGNLSEGSGQNIFLVRENVIHTPPIGTVP